MPSSNYSDFASWIGVDIYPTLKESMIGDLT